MKKFNYDVEMFIQMVQERPCIWDKTLSSYKDRVERKQAWEEIFANLDAGYENMNNEDKRLTGELVQTKWANLRDTFFRSLRLSNGKKKKKYVLYDYMKFLLKVAPEASIQHLGQNDDISNEDCESNIQFENSLSYDEHDEPSLEATETAKIKFNRNGERVSKIKKRRVTSGEESSDAEAEQNHQKFEEVDVMNGLRLMNEDEAFFASLLPTVVKYSEEEKLEFRIGVLSVMKNVKEKRNEANFIM